jgi:hypothetical protein
MAGLNTPRLNLPFVCGFSFIVHAMKGNQQRWFAEFNRSPFDDDERASVDGLRGIWHSEIDYKPVAIQA